MKNLTERTNFNRWKFMRNRNTGVLKTFNRHNTELSRMLIANIAARGFTYKNLGNQAKLEDCPSQHFDFKDKKHTHAFKNLGEWYENFKDCGNWINLNSVVAANANLETYMSNIIRLALESDPGVLYGASRAIDGMKIIKYREKQPFDFSVHITSCIKGDWNSRISSIERIFGEAPKILKDNIQYLERIRKIRNDVSHAFGRDIDASHNCDIPVMQDSQNISRLREETSLKYQKIIYAVAKRLDTFFRERHIGAYQELYLYHHCKNTLPSEHPSCKKPYLGEARALRQKTYDYEEQKTSVIYFQLLIDYYEKL